MPRNMSFHVTTEQFRDGSKTVTRRIGWMWAHPGMIIRAVVRSRGLKKGEHPEPLGMIRVIEARREQLCALRADPVYGAIECAREGFPNKTPDEFIKLFCAMNDCGEEAWVTRIEFERIEA